MSAENLDKVSDDSDEPTTRYQGRKRDLESSLASVEKMPSSTLGSRSASIISNATSVYETNDVELIGWSYQRTSEGEYVITSKDQFKDRYINEKVEEELVEFKLEIEKKF